MGKEKGTAILFVCSPQGSKDPSFLTNDLLGDRTFKGVVESWDKALGRDFTGSLDVSSQLASPVWSTASFYTFNSRLREQVAPGQLDLPVTTYVTGHSVGEMAGFVLAGITDIPTMAKILSERERVTSHPSDAGFRYMMAVIGIDVDNFELPFEKISKVFGHGVKMVSANRNTPRQIVLSIQSDRDQGEVIARELPQILAESKHPSVPKIKVRDLKMPTAFHSAFLGIEEVLFNQAIKLQLTPDKVKVPARSSFYSSMLGDWVRTRKQALEVISSQLTKQVNFRDAMQELLLQPNLLAIVTADVLDVTNGLVRDNLTTSTQLPIFNIKDEKTMKAAVDGCTDLINKSC